MGADHRPLVLLTGALGYIGGRLLKELYLLVKPAHNATPGGCYCDHYTLLTHLGHVQPLAADTSSELTSQGLPSNLLQVRPFQLRRRAATVL
jgi:hypothetical protein